MGSPPPTKARQVLKKGEVRPFVLAGLDPPRRVAELALPPGRAALRQRPEGQKGTPADKKPAGSAKAAPRRAARKTQASAKKAATPPAKATKAAKAAKKTTSARAAKKVPSARVGKKAAKKVAKKAGGAKKSTKKRAAGERP
jgi:DNA-binding protein HU-beta